MLPARSLLDLVEVERVKMDLIAECKKFGDIIKVEIPMPNQASAVARLP